MAETVFNPIICIWELSIGIEYQLEYFCSELPDQNDNAENMYFFDFYNTCHGGKTFLNPC